MADNVLFLLVYHAKYHKLDFGIFFAMDYRNVGFLRHFHHLMRLHRVNSLSFAIAEELVFFIRKSYVLRNLRTIYA